MPNRLFNDPRELVETGSDKDATAIEDAEVCIILPDPEAKSPAQIRSPRLANPEQAAFLAKQLAPNPLES